MSKAEAIRMAEMLSPISDKAASAEFASFYEQYRGEIGGLLGKLRDDDANIQKFELHAGMMPPQRAVVDAEIQRFCGIPYRTVDGTSAGCPGELRNLKGCPPYAPATQETVGLLVQARAFLIIQLEGREADTQQGHVHPFIEQLVATLREHGHKTLFTYASGPCRICAQGCQEGPECRQPERRLFAPEACGFWVNALCREAARFPVRGGAVPVEPRRPTPRSTPRSPPPPSTPAATG